MGCDGGTIPKRNEIVKNKQKHQARDKDAELAAKWQFCALSGLPLRKPIVACALGRIYNKTAIVEHLLDSPAKQLENAPLVAHIRSLRDVRELKLVEKTNSSPKHQQQHQQPSTTKGSEQFKAHFVCPVSGLDLNGKYKFYYLLQCGCVFSERALKQVPNDKQCLLCSKLYDPELDLIVLNGDQDEVAELRNRLERVTARRRKQHQKRSLDKTAPSTSDSTTNKHCDINPSHGSNKEDSHKNQMKKRRIESSVT